jgi:hypothetical protein
MALAVSRIAEDLRAFAVQAGQGPSRPRPLEILELAARSQPHTQLALRIAIADQDRSAVDTRRVEAGRGVRLVMAE